jgi:lipopolysaccharide/colanic/teichoic acid biosynthesis glycosyltransferase
MLFVGDIIVFVLSLWAALIVRFGAGSAGQAFQDHIVPFSALFVLWLLVFYMAGLYGKRIVLFKSASVSAILKTQLLNIVLAALFFFFTPGIGITPKTTLVLYLFISLALISVWRLFIFPRISRPAARERVALLASGAEALELMKEVNENPRYHIEFTLHTEPEAAARDWSAFAQALAEKRTTSIVVDMEHDALRPELARLYDTAFVKKDYHILDFYTVYEEVFDRVPLSLLQPGWFLKNVSHSGFHFFEAVKRLIDIIGALVMGVVVFVATPFVWIAMRIEGPGPLFITQQRLGRFGTKMSAYKFRTMLFSDAGKWKGEGENKVTRVGAFLRLTSLDEFPQFLNVLTGELSLIGPRNDIEALGVRLAEAVPFYSMRYIVKPGITGWAQINQQYEQGNISPQSIEETKVRLAYDFYYIKNRSLVLDMVIALKTVKRMVFRVGGTI